MTDQIDTNTPDSDEIESTPSIADRRRRMFLTGAGIAGAAAIVGKSGTASAATEVVDTEQDNESTLTTSITNSGTSTDRSNNAFKGVISNAGNNSHAVLGTTVGDGHAVAGVVGTPTGTQPSNPVAATWGRSYAASAATEGQNLAEDVAIAGDANGVKGIVGNASNGSHAVLGVTAGGGHSVAGDTPADATGPGGVGPNTTAATWGRHAGAGAGIGGINTGDGYGGEFLGKKAHVRLIQSDDASISGPPSGAAHLLGELYADGVGNLWYNTADGSNWVSLSKPAGGNVLFLDGQRAFDSRGTNAPASRKGRIKADQTIQIDLTEFTDFQAGFTGALLNVTVVTPSPGLSSYATVFNGDTADADRPNTSSINWSSTTDVVANSVTVRSGVSGTIKVFARQEIDLVIDVVGYIA